MKSQIIDINYNNEVISVRRDASLQQLMRNRRLVNLPLSEWNNLLIEKDGHTSEYALREVLKQQIANYDSSDNVNSFIIGGQKCWLDKATRVGLQQLVNSSNDEVSLVLSDHVLTIPKDIASGFLAQLEVYAGKCYLQTAKHQLAIKELQTVEELINYDYTKGYPEKLTFNV